MERGEERVLEYVPKTSFMINPTRLKAITKILGFDAPELENARILEIGCSYAENIIPISVGYENAEIYGIDWRKEHIEIANKKIQEIGLDNIKLKVIDILDYNGEFGKFDYIICHEIYSFVEDTVKDKIMEIIQNSLKENGVAHISYNTYPGWKYLEMYREAMLFRKETVNMKNIDEKGIVSLGRGIVEFIQSNTAINDEIRNNAKAINEMSDYDIYNQYFSEINDPVYLYDFNEKLNKYGLTHIIDSGIAKSFIQNNILNTLENECKDDYIAREQYYDFVNNTYFRNSIIVHTEKSKEIKNINDLLYEDLKGFYVRLSLNNSLSDDKIKKFFEKIYPNNIEIEKVIDNKKIDNKEFISALFSFDLDIEFEARKEIKNITKLKDRYRKYFEYFYNKSTDIVVGSKNGKSIFINNDILNQILNFEIKDMEKNIVDMLIYFDMVE